MTYQKLEALAIALLGTTLGFMSTITVQMAVVAVEGNNAFENEGTIAAKAMFPIALIGLVAAIALGYAIKFAAEKIKPWFTGIVLGFNFGFFIGMAMQMVRTMEKEYFLAFGVWFFFTILMVTINYCDRLSEQRSRPTSTRAR